MEIKGNGIYMIKAGANLFREIIVSTPDNCYVFFRQKNNMVSFWKDGLTSSGGRQLVNNRISLALPKFGKLKNDLFREHVNEGCSECGVYTYESFEELLKDQASDISLHFKTILDAILADNSVGLVALELIDTDNDVSTRDALKYAEHICDEHHEAFTKLAK